MIIMVIKALHIQAGQACFVFLADLKSAVDLYVLNFCCEDLVHMREFLIDLLIFRGVFYLNLCSRHRCCSRPWLAFSITAGSGPASPWPRHWPWLSSLCSLVLFYGEQ